MDYGKKYSRPPNRGEPPKSGLVKKNADEAAFVDLVQSLKFRVPVTDGTLTHLLTAEADGLAKAHLLAGMRRAGLLSADHLDRYRGLLRLVPQHNPYPEIPA